MVITEYMDRTEFMVCMVITEAMDLTVSLVIMEAMDLTVSLVRMALTVSMACTDMGRTMAIPEIAIKTACPSLQRQKSVAKLTLSILNL
jgi:hypothetical protein